MGSEQFQLKWDNFHQNMNVGITSLLQNEDLVDVTLAVDGRYIKAHKMVLSVCSPYFRELFLATPCTHPIFFMKDVSHTVLKDLLTFMYQGEVEVSQENLAKFIQTAEALQVKGLTAGANGLNETEGSSVADKKEEPTIERPNLVPRLRKAKSLPGSGRKRARLSEAGPSCSTQVATAGAFIKQCKVEPDQESEPEPEPDPDGGVMEESTVFDDDPLNDSALINPQDEYGMVEAAEDESKPGPNSEAREGQGEVCLTKRRSGIIVDGFTYHQNTVKKVSKTRYLICAEYKRLSCKARAQIPLGGSVQDVVLRREHNHPPVQEANLKNTFIVNLKRYLEAQPDIPLKEIFDRISISHPKGAELCPFKKISTSMRRWRQFALTKSLNE